MTSKAGWNEMKADVREMRRVFNMGIGFVLVVHESQEAEILLRLRHLGETAYTIGKIVERKNPTEEQATFQ